MSGKLFEHTNVASYYLWEYTMGESALALWVCAEDIANYLENVNIFKPEQIEGIRMKGIYSYEYIKFVRHLAYRIYIYTDNCDADFNWFAAEKLIKNAEWCQAVTRIAVIYNENKTNFESLQGIRSDMVKKSHNPVS